MATDPAEQVKAREFKCTACGGEQSYDAASGQLKCKFCGALRAVPAGAGAVVEHDFAAGLAAAPRGLDAPSTLRAAKCQECGANVVFPDGQTAARCTFCGSPKVLEQSENAQAIRPESLLPFGIDKKRANESFAKWLAGLWFRPSNLKRLAKVQDLAGVYVPFWTYDAHVDSSWTAEAGYYYYVDEEFTAQENGQTVTKTRQVRHTRWESAWGRRADDFDDVLVCASQGLPRELADHFKTFDTQKLVPYSAGFLAGWRAEEYAIDLQGGFSLAQQKMAAAQEQRCAHDVPGDTHRNLSIDNSYSAVTFKHVLLPLWIAAYRYQKKVYRFLVNGQTGEVVGKAPWSILKITLFVLGLALVAFLLYYFFGKPQ